MGWSSVRGRIPGLSCQCWVPLWGPCWLGPPWQNPQLPACLSALAPPFPVLGEALPGPSEASSTVVPLSPRLGPECQHRGLLPEGWGCRQCPGAQLCPSDLLTTHRLAHPLASQGSLCCGVGGWRHSVEAQFRQTYSLWNLGNGPGIARVAEAQTKATLLSYALPPAPSRCPWHLRGWGWVLGRNR